MRGRDGRPAAGPADPVSFALANRLAGNTVTAGRARAHGRRDPARLPSACHVAAVGAAPEVRVDGVAAAAGRILPLEPRPGARGGRLRGGCRCYLSVAGGFLGPVWFGSPASDELTGLGAGPLAAGARAARRRVGAAAR